MEKYFVLLSPAAVVRFMQSGLNHTTKQMAGHVHTYQNQ